MSTTVMNITTQSAEWSIFRFALVGSKNLTSVKSVNVVFLSNKKVECFTPTVVRLRKHNRV